MRKHCSKERINKLGVHAHRRDHSAAAAIFANGTYFLDNPRTFSTSSSCVKRTIFTYVHKVLYKYLWLTRALLLLY